VLIKKWPRRHHGQKSQRHPAESDVDSVFEVLEDEADEPCRNLYSSVSFIAVKRGGGGTNAGEDEEECGELLGEALTFEVLGHKLV
jgi:hypothetical protein